MSRDVVRHGVLLVHGLLTGLLAASQVQATGHRADRRNQKVVTNRHTVRESWSARKPWRRPSPSTLVTIAEVANCNGCCDRGHQDRVVNTGVRQPAAVRVSPP
ncbi:hypothetical protein GCM10010443_84060 [Actinoplanes cyaneus]